MAKKIVKVSIHSPAKQCRLHFNLTNLDTIRIKTELTGNMIVNE